MWMGILLMGRFTIVQDKLIAIKMKSSFKICSKVNNSESFEVIGCFGLVGNLLSIIVLNTKDMRSNCFNNLLTALNMTDRCYSVKYDN